MPGLINLTPDTESEKDFLAPGKTAQTKAVGYDPTLGTVNLDTDTVSGQLDKLLSKDNPYVTRARTSAAEGANARGLLNSSMAVQAGEAAAIDAALPIAQQDANTFSNQRLTNQQFSNTAGQFGAGAANQAGIINADAANRIAQQQLAGEQNLGSIAATGSQQRMTQAEAATQTQALQAQRGEIDKQLQSADAATREKLLAQQGEIDSRLQALRGEQETALQAQRGEQEKVLQQMRGDQQKEFIEIEARYKTIMQADDSAAKLFAQISNSISEIQSNADIPAEQKDALVQTQIDLLKNGMTVIGGASNLDLAGLLEFPEPPPPPEKAEGSQFTQEQLDELAELPKQQQAPLTWINSGNYG